MNNIRDEEKIPQKKKINWKRFGFWLLAIIIVFSFLYIIYRDSVYVDYFDILDSCSGNLRNLGIVVTNYSTDHEGHFPQNLKHLTTLGYIDTLPACPFMDKPYVYSIDGWDDDDFTIWCPNPEEHEGIKGPKSTTASLYYHKGEGVIQVDK